MYVLGVTGGIGSGKSTVSSLLAERGARVLDADRVVRELYDGGPLVDRIAGRFGGEVRADDGSVDRAELGARVFRDPDARRALEDIVLPAVREAIQARLDAWKEEGFAGVAVVDAALLVEAGDAYPLDSLVVVTAPVPLRLDRLEARGTPREDATRRMAAQSTDEEKAAAADVVLANDGTLEDLRRRVGRLWDDLPRDATAASGYTGAPKIEEEPNVRRNTDE